MSDQHNAKATGYAGNPDVKTPHLDALAKDGVAFSRAFCNNPVCSPSRISFNTGQYVHTHGYHGNNNRNGAESNPNTLAYLLKRNGYETAHIGKSHTVPSWDKEANDFLRYNGFCDAEVGNPLTNHYFKYLYDKGIADQYEEGIENKNGNFPEAINGSKPWTLNYEDTVEHFTGEQTLEFLKNRNTEKPFYVFTSFLRPHDPYTPAKEFFDRYNPDDISLPETAHDVVDGFPTRPDFIRDRIEKNKANMPEEWDRFNFAKSGRLKQALASYYALITENDHEIGRIIAYLKENNLYENTVIVYTADHGDFAGYHGLMAKGVSIYDAIHNIPMVIRFPDGPRGEENNDLVESVDVYPTLCALAGVEVPDGVDGKNIYKDKKVSSDKEAAFCEANGIAAIRTKKFRMVHHSHLKEHELYDLEKDPGELRNVYQESEYSEVKVDLLERLQSFTSEYAKRSSGKTDMLYSKDEKVHITNLIHKGGKYASDFEKELKELNKNP